MRNLFAVCCLPYLCVIAFIPLVKTSKISARINALETLFRQEIFLLRETVESNERQSEIFMSKLNETIERISKFPLTETMRENVDNVQITKTSGRLNEDTQKTADVDEMLTRLKRGFREEKKSRKRNAIHFNKELSKMSQNVIDIKTEIGNFIGDVSKKIDVQTETIRTVVDENINDIKENISSFSGTLSGTMQQTLASFVSKYKNIEQKVTHLEDAVNEIKGATTNIAEIVQSVLLITGKSSSTTDLLPTCDAKVVFGDESIESCLKDHVTGLADHLLTPVRLMGGGSENEGRVEIYYHGFYRTVCDDYFDANAAFVVCRMLGYHKGRVAEEHQFGSGTGRILLDDVNCTSTERSLLICGHRNLFEHNCSHNEDVGVICG